MSRRVYPRTHELTKAYVERWTAKDKSNRDIIRCLKRFVTREAYHLIKASVASKIVMQDS